MEIDTELANRLVDFLVINLNIPKIDAKMYMKHYPGIIRISGKEETQNLSQAFRAAGLDNFVIEEKDFVPLPKREPITSCLENITKTPALVAAGMIYKASEHITKSWNPLNVRMIFMSPMIYDSGVREKRKTNVQATYYIDIITREKRWQIARPMIP